MKTSAMLLIPAMVLASSTALADRYKRIEQVIDASDLEQVHLDISVGEVDIEIYDGDEIQLEIDIEAQRSWFSFRRADADDVELEVNNRGSEIYIGIDEQDIEQTWFVRMPAKLALEFDMGVGDVSIENFANNLDMELGVGAVRVEVADAEYDMIHASAGVGDTSVRGFENRSDNERSFISADSYYQGEGELEMEIEVGVGDIEVRKL